MPVSSQLDLRGITWPVCLLTFKQNLLGLKVGERLEVLVQDPEVADQIFMIVDRSADKVIDRQRDEERFRFWIEKGESLD